MSDSELQEYEENTEVVIKKDDLIKDLDTFAKGVLTQMQKDKVEATPFNFSIYFNRLLTDKKDLAERVSTINTPMNAPSEQQALMESEVKRGFSGIKSIFQVVNLIYKNLIVMDRLTKKHFTNLSGDLNAFEVKDCIRAFQSDLGKFNDLMDKHIEIIKNGYDQVSRIFQNISDQSVYDSKFGIFNKQYFLSALRDELENVAHYAYSATLLLVRVSDSSLNSLSGLKDKESVLKSVASELYNAMRRSDFVAHYDKAIFAVLLFHTNLDDAKLAKERIAKILFDVKFEIADRFALSLDFSLAPLEQKFSAEEIVSHALDGLELEENKISAQAKTLKDE